jgi:hypothetical protein
VLKYRMNNAFRNNDSEENSDENIIKVIWSEIKAAVQTAIREASSSPTLSTTPRLWASIAGNRLWKGNAGIAQEPHIVIPARREKKSSYAKKKTTFFNAYQLRSFVLLTQH